MGLHELLMTPSALALAKRVPLELSLHREAGRFLIKRRLAIE